MSAILVPYLGMAGALRALPSPRPGSTLGAPSMGDAVSTSLGGVSSVFRFPYPRRTFNLQYGYTTEADADLLLGFYQGLFGLGPHIFVDSSARNVLPLDVSACGVRTWASHGWVASAGTLAAGTTPPTLAPNSGVLVWSAPTASATLQPGLTAGVADPLTACPYLPTEAVTVSLWVKAASSVSVTLRLAGFTSAGVFGSSLSTTVTATTAWQQVTVSAAAGNGTMAGSVFVMPRLVSSGTVVLSIAGAQLEYGTAATTWQPGFSTPRVNIVAPPGRDLPLIGRSDHTLVLAE